jgi:hypothetical protein
MAPQDSFNHSNGSTPGTPAVEPPPPNPSTPAIVAEKPRTPVYRKTQKAKKDQDKGDDKSLELLAQVNDDDVKKALKVLLDQFDGQILDSE